jgi:hypothetical protein
MGPISRNVSRYISYVSRLAVVIAAIAIAVAPSAGQAEPLVAEQSAPAAHVVQAGYLTPWPGACPFGQHYTCWRGSYGGRYCGCWVGGDRPACPAGYYYTCRPDPFGNPYCACY